MVAARFFATTQMTVGILAFVAFLPSGTLPASAQEPGSPTEERADATEPVEEIVLEARPVAPSDPVDIFRLGGSDYTIGRQDLLEISVFDLEELNQTVRVSDDGSITVPLLGRLQVAGLAKGELEGLVARLLEERYVRDPQVTVFVREYESRKVAVSGAVKRPDTYEMLGRKTLLEMISRAGGLDAEFGKEIIIFRGDDAGNTQKISVDLERLMYAGDPLLNKSVHPGDIIYVPALEKVRIFVSGAVNRPNLYEVPKDEPVTVLKAITLAGGTTDRASSRRVQIHRSGEGGQRVIISVDLRKIKRGKADDVILQRDDVVLVPESFF